MTQSELIRKLYTLTPNTQYGKLLKEEFNVTVPPGAPLYQQEYLYKYCLQLASDQSVPEDDIVMEAAKKVNAFIDKYPWCKTKYETVLAHKEKIAKREFKEMFKDHLVVFSEKYQKYMYYKDNNIACRSNTLDGLQKVVTRKFGPTVSISKSDITIIN